MAVREIRITPESLSARLSLKVKAGGATLRLLVRCVDSNLNEEMSGMATLTTSRLIDRPVEEAHAPWAHWAQSRWTKASPVIRRRTVALGGTLAVGAAGAAVALRRHHRRGGMRQPVTGTFPNGMGYARFGTGGKSLLWIGGPSVGAPQGFYLRAMGRLFRPFVADGFSVWLVAQRENRPQGQTVADMADDYAALIAEEFDGIVDLAVGHSTGGMIGFYLAARHPDSFGHIAIAGAGCEWTEQADTTNLKAARLMSEGKLHDAAAVLIRFNNPPRVPGLVDVLAEVMARVSLSAPFNPSDVLIEAEALHHYDPRPILPGITVPILLTCGDQDGWFPKEVIEETARLIPRCTLKLYPGKNHLSALSTPDFSKDVLDFTRR